MPNANFDIETIRHSLSHILAAAVLEMFPEAKLGIGPAIENGFYYDFDLPRTLIPEDLPLIEERMRKIIASDEKFEKVEIGADEAIDRLSKSDQKYKLELIEDLQKAGEKKVSLYKTGNFIDLCIGPHVDSSSDLKDAGFKLDKIAGAYWKGSEKNKMLQRIYGLAFATEKELDEFLKHRDEAEKRDHRVIGKELDLFSLAKGEAALTGSVYWHPKGAKLFNLLENFMSDKLSSLGYQEIITPIIYNRSLWEKSGHWDKYRDNMFFCGNIKELKQVASRGRDPFWGIKPMNCPGLIAGIYNRKKISYKELPLRYSEFGLVHRNEASGEMHGLMRLKAFTQDDAHIFCTSNQVKEEISKLIDLSFEIYKNFGLGVDHIELSTRPEKSIGSNEIWEKAESIMKEIMSESKIDCKINEGDGAFYGPKFDFHLKDTIGRTWQLGTIQLDFAMPENFNLTYINHAGKQERPVMIHRVILGAVERFLGIYIEHTAGAFPVWLAPVQAMVLPISDKHLDYAKKVADELRSSNIRVEIDDRSESIGKKIREAEMQKIPYMLVVGDKEIEAKKVALRKYRDGDQGQVDLAKVISEINS